jgi:hypothetical protein
MRFLFFVYYFFKRIIKSSSFYDENLGDQIRMILKIHRQIKELKFDER